MRATRAATFVLAAVVLAGCGSDEPVDEEDVAADGAGTEETEPEETTSEDEGADEPDEAAEPDAEDGPQVAVAETPVGEVLVDGEGYTLYLFEPDEQGASTCYDECAANWPPHVGASPSAGDGADASLLDTTERDDGEMQVTYDGWPLYRWAGDEAPGDVNGQGVQDVWWVVAADGSPQRDAAAAGTEEESTPSY